MGDVFKNIKNATINNKNKIIIKETPTEKKHPNSKKPSDERIDKLKLLIQQNKLATCLEELMSIFKITGNKEGLKETIMFSSRLTEINQKERHELIGADKVLKLRGRLKEGILGLLEVC